MIRAFLVMVNRILADLDGVAQHAADFTNSHASPILHRNFHSSQLGSRGLNLHFNSPSEIAIFHCQLTLGVELNRSERTEVRIVSFP